LSQRKNDKTAARLVAEAVVTDPVGNPDRDTRLQLRNTMHFLERLIRETNDDDSLVTQGTRCLRLLKDQYRRVCRLDEAEP
jgi:hypothetical protein